MKCALTIVMTLSLAALFASCAETAPEDLTTTFLETAPSSGTVERTIEAAATASPFRDIKVGTEISGEVISVPVTFNSEIAIGDTLAVIDPAALVSVIEQTKSEIAEAEFNITRQELLIQRAALERETAKALAQREMELLAERATSKADFERAQRDLNISNLDLELSQVTLKTRVARLNLLKARLSAALNDLDNSIIKSPIDGIVIERKVEVGQTVQAQFNAKELFIIAERRDAVQLTADVAENDIWSIDIGDRVRVTATSNPAAILLGSVSDIRQTPKIENGLTKYAVIISLDDAAPKLRPGMNASVQIIVETSDAAVRIPLEALTFVPRDSERHPDTPKILVQTRLDAREREIGDALTLLNYDADRIAKIVDNVGAQGEAIYAASETPLSERKMVERHETFRDKTNQTLLRDLGASDFKRYIALRAAASNVTETIVWEVRDGRLRPMPVRIGVTDSASAEVLSGLSDNGLIVIGR